MTTHADGSNSQSPRWKLPRDHEELLRSALRSNGSARVVTPEQRAIIQQICSAQEKRSFAPEDFVIAFKLALTNAANDVGIKPGPDRNDLLARLVSVCIEEFFRSPSAIDATRSAKAIRPTSPQENSPEATDR